MVDGVGAHADLLERLGPNTTGVGCIYLKDLTLVDLAIVEQIFRTSYATLTAGRTHSERARVDAPDDSRFAIYALGPRDGRVEQSRR